MLHDVTIGETPTDVNRQNENTLALLPTGPVVSLSTPEMEHSPHRKSLYILRENIRSLLDARGQDQKSLAEWCHHDKSWMNKFLNEGRGIRVGDFDRIADFFGLATYQLFQPGISRVTERRKGERRIGRERRISHTGRLASHLQSEVNKFPRFARRADYDLGALPASLRALVEKVDREIAAWEAAQSRRQAAGDRGQVPPAPKNRRGRGGPDPDASA